MRLLHFIQIISNNPHSSSFYPNFVGQISISMLHKEGHFGQSCQLDIGNSSATPNLRINLQSLVFLIVGREKNHAMVTSLTNISTTSILDKNHKAYLSIRCIAIMFYSLFVIGMLSINFIIAYHCYISFSELGFRYILMTHFGGSLNCKYLSMNT